MDAYEYARWLVRAMDELRSRGGDEAVTAAQDLFRSTPLSFAEAIDEIHRRINATHPTAKDVNGL